MFARLSWVLGTAHPPPELARGDSALLGNGKAYFLLRRMQICGEIMLSRELKLVHLLGSMLEKFASSKGCKTEVLHATDAEAARPTPTDASDAVSSDAGSGVRRCRLAGLWRGGCAGRVRRTDGRFTERVFSLDHAGRRDGRVRRASDASGGDASDASDVCC